MPRWVKCTTIEGTDVHLNVEHVAMIRPHRSDRGFTGSEVIFSTGQPSSVIVQEGPDDLTGLPDVQPVRSEV